MNPKVNDTYELFLFSTDTYSKNFADHIFDDISTIEKFN